MTARRHLAALISSQFRDELRAGEVLMVVLPFAVVGLLAIPMAVGIDTPLLERIGSGMYWVIVMLFGVIVTQRHSSALPTATRDMIRLAGVDPAVRFGATALVSFLLLLIFEVGAGLVALVLYGSTVPGAWWLVAILPLTAAGLAMLGTPARKAGANFSSMPHTGKLKALICTATPGREVKRCAPRNVPSAERTSGGPSSAMAAFGSSRRPLLA